MRCLRCQSEDVVRIGHLVYCRNCLMFGRYRPYVGVKTPSMIPCPQKVTLELAYTLSDTQQKISDGVKEAVLKKQKIVISAVCGSGKTELVYESIITLLNMGKRVCFSLPRQALAIEIYERLSTQLNHVSSCLVYGGHTSELEGALVVCTTHQLYRFEGCFDLLIIDEIDAFPFKGNPMLHHAALRACCGSLILMSATVELWEIPNDFVIFELNRRYHNHDLPIPKLKLMNDAMFKAFCMKKMKEYRQLHHPLLIFVPHQTDGERLSSWFSYMGFKVAFVSSKTTALASYLDAFKQGEYDALFTTTILERGMTFKHCHVIVYHSDDAIFDSPSLIQIAGRVGRKQDAYDGDIYFCAHRKTKAMIQCVKHLRMKNDASRVDNR